jgi:hypothetical protein
VLYQAVITGMRIFQIVINQCCVAGAQQRGAI